MKILGVFLRCAFNIISAILLASLIYADIVEMRTVEFNSQKIQMKILC